jgi:glycosyltransferase involved in cell wall biosynthesis
LSELSIIIPAREEVYLQNTIEDILKNSRADTEIIVILDGYWPNPPIPDHKKVTIVHHAESIGQRAATNEGARIAQSKYIMKVDAHCSFGEGFDKILIEDCQYDWTLIPTLYNLHVFNWKCDSCGKETYQGAEPELCKSCHKKTTHSQKWIWERRAGKGPYFSWRFDSDLVFQQWRKHHRRSECQGDYVETMSFAGPCFFIHRDRYWELGGCDEGHGSWGQFGTEWACKTWLSGGKLITTRRTWFAHLFRTGNFKGTGYRGSAFPYRLSGKAQGDAKRYSQDYWLNNKYPNANYSLWWLVNKFWPVPGWAEEDLKNLQKRHA